MKGGKKGMIIITRRQFLKWATASAAALGLSQTDLLKLEEAMGATICGCNDYGAAHVIWFQGQSCGGCTLSILNRMRINIDNTGESGLNDMGTWTWNQPNVAEGANGVPSLKVVQDVVDLLLGDAVGYLTGTNPRAGWATFPNGYISLDYQSEVMASTGLEINGSPPAPDNTIANYIECLRNGSTPYFVAVSGAIPSKDVGLLTAGNQPYCVVGSFDTGDPLGLGRTGRIERSIVEVLEWLATGPKFSGLVAFGSCASWGGIPGAHGNLTKATSVYNYLVNMRGHSNLSGAIINCPGCAPHPDWMIYPVAHILTHGGSLPPLDSTNVNINVWKPDGSISVATVPKNTPRAIYTSDKGYTHYCEVCPRYSLSKLCYDLGAGKGKGTLEQVGGQDPKKEYCTRPVGCNGPYATPDCPTRMWNNFDDHTRNQWCAGDYWGGGAPGDSPYDGSATVKHTGANYVCQGCAEHDFPDGRSPFFEGTKGYTW
jgi:Ni,Fe-hydrogenase I small subunit